MATYNAIKYNVDYGGFAGSLIPIAVFTSDGSDATATFTSGIDSTYDTYLFIFNNIHPQTDNTTFGFNGSIDSGSNYNVTKTTTFLEQVMKKMIVLRLYHIKQVKILHQEQVFNN